MPLLSALAVLDLSGNMLRDEGVRRFAVGVGHSRSRVRLDLSSVGLSSRGLSGLAERLPECSCLRQLGVLRNDLHGGGRVGDKLRDLFLTSLGESNPKLAVF